MTRCDRTTPRSSLEHDAPASSQEQELDPRGVALLPCPFCGGEARVSSNAAKGRAWVSCCRCMAESGGFEDLETSMHILQADAAKEWNCRSALPRAVSGSEAVVEALAARLLAEADARDRNPDDHDEGLTRDIRDAAAALSAIPAVEPAEPVVWQTRKKEEYGWSIWTNAAEDLALHFQSLNRTDIEVRLYASPPASQPTVNDLPAGDYVSDGYGVYPASQPVAERERDEARYAAKAYERCKDLSRQGWSALSDARLFLLNLGQPDDITEAAQCIDLAQASFADTIIASEARLAALEAATIEKCAKVAAEIINKARLSGSGDLRAVRYSVERAIRALAGETGNG